MADKLWLVEGHYTKNGTKETFDNVFSASNKSGAEKAAKKDFDSYVSAGYEKNAKFGKLTVTKVSEWTEKDRKAFLKKKGIK
ncbi:hypothetical protein SEA_MILDRED21_125 [Streptomyces phage Mildred21]|uniref:Uncharacterized protein n=1 Tax=Streptomyces phage Mildred21 TaxID=2023959 RepID=A0A222YU68_9CAUD|nr:hypothetical protein FDI35_gp156 [Streptomyces phage Mildred21]ASR75522.1 hypothetical protein SEA_MILDRED21_125 [Streptomyces phage Mildred21]